MKLTNKQMWFELFLCNRDQLLHHMDAFTESFDALRKMPETEDREGLQEAMRKSTARRALFDKKDN